MPGVPIILDLDPGWPGADLALDDVHVARFDVDLIGGGLEEYLSSKELARASSFHFEVDKVRYIAGRGALRWLLGRYLDVSPRSLQIDSDGVGKPHLSGHHGSVHFNVSHSGSLLMIVITQGMPVGIDVEKIDTAIPHGDMARRFFSPTEIAAFESGPEEIRIDHFFSTWTRKEAYLKGIGEGLTRSPDGFSVAVAPEATPVEDASRSDRWWTANIDTADGFVGALAVPRRQWTIRPFEIVASAG